MKVYLSSPYSFLWYRGGRELIKKVFACEGDEMKIFLAGCYSRPFVFDDMKLYMAGLGSNGNIPKDVKKDVSFKLHPYILESFYYMDAGIEKLIPLFGDFLLDSGAFTFIQNNHNKKIDWDVYIEEYADFIKRNNIKKYFELDIDSIIGYEKVKEYREKLENLVGWKCIPVWHRDRGYDEYLKLCDEYDYIAIGGIAINEIKKSEYPIFTRMIKDAHIRNCKVHGLGFTQLKELWKYKFDSVDSTAWTAGNRFGFLFFFDGKTMRKFKKKDNQKLINVKEVAIINFTEWIKFQNWAEKNL